MDRNISRRIAVLTLIGLCSNSLSMGETIAVEDTPRAEQSPITPQNGPIRLLDNALGGNCYTWLEDAKRGDPRKVFRIEDGILRISGDGWGSIITKSAYRDYHLVLEFKWGDKTWRERASAARDSGLLIHSKGANGGYRGIWMPGIEVQIIEGGVGDFILVDGPDKTGKPVPLSVTCNVGRDRDGEVVWSEKGAREIFNLENRQRINWFGRDPDWTDTKGFRGRRDLESPHGEWTRLDVFADGGHVKVYVNGTLVNEAFGVSPSQGRLQLQSELAEVYFRRWELWPPGEGPKPAAAENRSTNESTQ